MSEVQLMNKKEAIAYAQITLNYMQSSKYTGKVSPENLGIEMKQTFKLYPRDIILSIADSQVQASKVLKTIKSGSDADE